MPVQAVVNLRDAVRGNRQPVGLVLSVTHPNGSATPGRGVPNLGVGAFQFQVLTDPASESGGVILAQDGFVDYGRASAHPNFSMDGVYAVLLHPVEGTWKSGEYTFAIALSDPGPPEQTLVSVRIP
jgi:hypothetical protein